MASQEELENQKKFREELEDILFLQRSFTDEALKSAKAVLGVSEGARETVRAFRGISNLTEEIASGFRGYINDEKTLTDLAKLQIKQKEKINVLQIEADNIIKSILGENSKLTKNILDQNNIQSKGKAIQDAISQTRKVLTKDEKVLLSLYADQLITLDEQEKKLSQIEEAKKTTGIIGDIGSGIEGLLKKLGASDLADRLGFKKAQAAAEDYAFNVGEGASKFQAAGIYIKTLGSNLLKALGPLALIAELVKGIMQADKETTELQKSMGLTKDQASGFRMNLASAAASSNNLNITTTKLLETYNSINKQFGFIARFSDETLVNTTRLTKQVGLSAEAANALAGLTERQGSNAEELYETTVGTVLQLQKQSGIQIDQREIFEQIGKTTGTIRANLGSNPITIATAIQKSKEFGASLQDVANAGKALLDFESSITSELEAELLLGKNINLERARAAALAGDQVTLAQELQQQAGSFSDFSAMNVIQQEALAKAMGMSSDQLADILYQQDLQTKGAEKVRAELMATGQEDAVRALDAQSAQDKFNATVEKLQGVFADVGTAFMPILQLFGDLLSLVNLIIAPITDLVQLIVGLGRVTAGILSGNSFGNTDAFSEIKFSTPQAFGMETADDAIIPSGYGETIIKKGKDTIALNNNDTVVAGTNLGGGSGDQEAKKTNQLLERLLNQPAVFKIGTDEFYTATSKYSYQIQ
jgi:hypothetical protein